MMTYLAEENEGFDRLGYNHRMLVAQKLKHKYCFVSQDLDADEDEAMDTNKFKTSYKLPSGQKLEMNESRFLAPETIFDPSIGSMQFDEKEGLHRIAFDSIQEVDIDNRRELYQSVVLSGGSSLMKGLPERLEKELDAIAPQANMIKIYAP